MSRRADHKSVVHTIKIPLDSPMYICSIKRVEDTSFAFARARMLHGSARNLYIFTSLGLRRIERELEKRRSRAGERERERERETGRARARISKRDRVRDAHKQSRVREQTCERERTHVLK